MIFPNPTNGELNIDLTSFLDSSLIINVFNSVGQLIFERKLEANHEIIESIELSNLASGIYYLKIKNETSLMESTVVLTKE